MTQQNLDLAELQELKNQFSMLDMKLEKQRIINEEMIEESMKEKLSYIERWYKNRFVTSMVAAPVGGIVFMANGYWGFGILILLTGLLEFFLNRKAYNALDARNLPGMNMTQAAENIIRHRRLRSITNRILALPLIALIVWTILIAGGYAWNLKVIALTLFAMGASISWGLYEMKMNHKRLDAVLEQIRKLRE
jgi:hypothetical protein